MYFFHEKAIVDVPREELGVCFANGSLKATERHPFCLSR